MHGPLLPPPPPPPPMFPLEKPPCIQLHPCTTNLVGRISIIYHMVCLSMNDWGLKTVKKRGSVNVPMFSPWSNMQPYASLSV